jgi:hypothetical protein
MAESNLPCLIVDGWPKTMTAFSFTEDGLKIYPTAPANARSFNGLTPSSAVPDDTISYHGYALLYSDDEAIQAFGIKVLQDHVVLIGRDATGFFSVKAPGCSAVLKTTEDTHSVKVGLRRTSSGLLRETLTKVRILNVTPDCVLTTASTSEIGEEHTAYPLRDGVLIVDKENKALHYYR